MHGKRFKEAADDTLFVGGNVSNRLREIRFCRFVQWLFEHSLTDYNQSRALLWGYFVDHVKVLDRALIIWLPTKD